MRTARWVMLFTACLTFAPVAARAQSCGGEPTVSDQASFAAYTAWCICMGGTVAGDLNTAQVEGGCRFPDRPQVALQNAFSRYDRLVRLLANDDLVDGSWFALPRGTDAQFLDTASRLHEFLVSEATRRGAAREKLLDELARAKDVIESYPRLIGSVRSQNVTLQAERALLDVMLEAAQQKLERVNRATGEIETLTSRYVEEANHDQDTIQQWLTVFLPPSVVDAVSPKPYESLPVTVGGRPARERAPEAVAVPRSIPRTVTGRPVNLIPIPLAGTPEDAVAQLETDVVAFRTAIRPIASDLLNELRSVRPIAAQLRQERTKVMEARDGLRSGIERTRRQWKEISNWSLLLAEDALQSARESFTYRAADALIWRRAKAETVQALKHEAKRFVAAKTMGVRDMTDEQVHAFFITGRQNIFGLSDRALTTGHALYPVVNRFQILRTHALESIEEAIRLISEGSPREIDEFIGTMYAQMHEDTRELLKAGWGAARIPEPWKSIFTRYLLYPPK